MSARTAPEARGDRIETEAWRRPKGGPTRRRVPPDTQPRRAKSATRASAVATWVRWAVSSALALLVLAVAPGHASETSLKPWTDGVRELFALDLVGGGRADIAALRGRVVLVHFFATWCEPCRAEMASLQRLALHYAGQPLTIVAVNVAEVAPRVARFFESQPVSFPVLLDSDRAITKAWQVEGLPTTVVLDPALTPVLVAAGDLDWDRADIRHAVETHLPDRSSN